VSAGRFADLRAHAALSGYELMRTAAEDGAVQYLVARWGQVKTLGTLDDVEDWLLRAGVVVPRSIEQVGAL
jgi:hypothetical protein